MWGRIKAYIRWFFLKRKIKYGVDYFIKQHYFPYLSERTICIVIVKHAKKLSDTLGMPIGVNNNVLALLKAKFRKYGLPYCPCRFERSPDNVCPCKHHVKELIKHGRCKCGLFYVKKKS